MDLLYKDSQLIGILTPIDGACVDGYISVQGTLIGEISSEEGISGEISTVEEPLNGILTIPPEIPVDIYEGDYNVVSRPFTDGEFQTQGLKMRENLVVLKIPYHETSNEHGYTIYIGGED